MENSQFYQILDRELEEIISEKSLEEEYSKRVANPNQLKSYAFMDWFLRFYAKGFYGHMGAIVDGPGDTSCDIIFSKMNFEGKMIYYIVQSKWNKIEKCDSLIDSTEIKKALNDFQTIIHSQKQNTQNKKFNEKLKALYKHIQKNGEVEIIFLFLCKWNPEAEDNLNSFNKNNANVNVRIIDIEQLKRDYIEIKYKKLEEQNLLERKYNPQEEEIKIPLERLNTTNNQIIIPEPFKAGVFLVRPSFFFKLFERYGYSLFIENVRNPIKKSEINKNMQETLRKNPAFFWYYNNGVTAITNSLPTISKQAKEFTVQGLQIINGAQTVHAIHSVYVELGPKLRKKMDEEVLVLLRLYKSGGEDFNRNVTKFTNAQNTMHDRDFWANDPVQIRLQKESFNTKYWYERRGDEFVEKPEGVLIISNKLMAKSYIAFFWSQPWITKKSFEDEAIEKFDALFLSKKEDNHLGFYELIFNSNTRYLDMLVAYLLYLDIDNIVKDNNAYSNLKLGILALIKPLLEKYLTLKYNDVINCVDYIWKRWSEKDYSETDKIIRYIYSYITKEYDLESINNNELFLDQEIQKLKVLLPAKMKLEDIESI